jgi:Flp pilus assembly protein TadG
MTKYAKASSLRTPRRGSAAVEFAIVFPLFFLILYAIITYSMLFLAQEGLAAAAEEGARAALVWQNAAGVDAALQARAQQACNRAASFVEWLPVAPTCTNTISMAPAGCDNNPEMDCIQVTLTYAYGTNPLVPLLPLLSRAIPQSVVGQATVQIDPENLQ